MSQDLSSSQEENQTKRFSNLLESINAASFHAFLNRGQKKQKVIFYEKWLQKLEFGFPYIIYKFR